MAKKKSDGKKLRIVSRNELEEIIEEHRLWVLSVGKRGTKADLSYVDLSGMDLRGINFSYTNLSYSDLSNTNCLDVQFDNANLTEVNFSGAFLVYSVFVGANVDRANFNKAVLNSTDFFVTKNLKTANISQEQLKFSMNVPSIGIVKSINVENQASFEIENLKKELEEQKKQLTEAKKGEEDKIKVATKLIEDKLEEKEKELERERAAKKSTKEDIEKGITHLQAPNSYLKSQINIQYGLTILYGILGIIAVWFLFHYVYDHYSEFKENLTEKTTFLQWLFYALPIAICFSLIITFINQINRRLRNVIVLHEKKRYVDSISGGLKAVQELSENNKEARERISNVLDVILNNTITLSEKLQEDTLPDEKSIDDKVSLSLKDLKDLLSK